MKIERYILLICMAGLLALTGCGSKKAVQTVPVPEVPSWHTCLIQGARATVVTDEDKITSAITLQTVHDSMLVISATPVFGVEMMRIEATPTELIAIDKLHGLYAKATYAELNRKLTPSLNWDILQQLCTAELPTGAAKGRLVFSFEDKTIEISIDYPQRRLDVPVRVTSQRLDKYTQVDISRWLE